MNLTTGSSAYAHAPANANQAVIMRNKIINSAMGHASEWFSPFLPE
jgi:hypothetical protein